MIQGDLPMQMSFSIQVGDVLPISAPPSRVPPLSGRQGVALCGRKTEVSAETQCVPKAA